MKLILGALVVILFAVVAVIQRKLPARANNVVGPMEKEAASRVKWWRENSIPL